MLTLDLPIQSHGCVNGSWDEKINFKSFQLKEEKKYLKKQKENSKADEEENLTIGCYTKLGRACRVDRTGNFENKISILFTSITVGDRQLDDATVWRQILIDWSFKKRFIEHWPMVVYIADWNFYLKLYTTYNQPVKEEATNQPVDHSQK